jgi:TRAP-type C4-dicarboxylate transport system substrate-binding protein
MTFTYYFDNDEWGFDYEPHYSDIQYYLDNNLTDVEIAKYVKEWFEGLPEADQKEILSSFEETEPNYMQWVKDDRSWCISEVLMDESMLEYFEDELKEFFEEDAYEMFKDAELYRKDPYGYNGVSPSDFY